MRSGGLRPAGPPSGVARGAPRSPLRSARRARFRSLVQYPGGFAPPDPPAPSLAGPHAPRSAPRGSLASAHSFTDPGGFAPPDPPAASLAGPRDPHSAPPARSLRSLVSIPGGLAPPDPPAASLAGPRDPHSAPPARSLPLTRQIRGASPRRTPRSGHPQEVRCALGHVSAHRHTPEITRIIGLDRTLTRVAHGLHHRARWLSGATPTSSRSWKAPSPHAGAGARFTPVPAPRRPRGSSDAARLTPRSFGRRRGSPLRPRRPSRPRR